MVFAFDFSGDFGAGAYTVQNYDCILTHKNIVDNNEAVWYTLKGSKKYSKKGNDTLQ